MDAIQIHGLRIRQDHRVLMDGFSLRLPAGGRCTITGPSGSGKSTLLSCLLGFMTPESGLIEILGRRLDASTVWSLRRKIAWVPQEADLGQGTGREFLHRPFTFRANRGLDAPDNMAPELAERFLLLPGTLDKKVELLSGGEKQRLALISALTLRRPILLLDEASSALDPASRDAVAEYLRSSTNAAIVSVAHEPEKFNLGGEVIDLGGAARHD